MHRVVNMNGNSAEALVKEQNKVLSLCEDLLQALAEATPHGRDYQCNEDPEMDLKLDRLLNAEDRAAVERVAEHARMAMRQLFEQQCR